MRAGAKVASRAEYTMLESIQNAYQGFAKQNYTMLDNLKLGYGGTKKEMERLLADAEKISGVKYNMDNLGDVYEAIHVIQGELGLTGVAADEASGTFTGSMGAMKAAAENLLANLSLGQDIKAPLESLIGNTKAFLLNNMLPMIGNIIKQIPTLLTGLRDIGRGLIEEFTQGIKENAANLVTNGADLLKNIVTGMIDNTVMLVQAAVEIGKALWDALKTVDWVGVANDLMTSLKTGITNAANSLFGDGATLETIIQSLMSKLSEFVTVGSDIVLSLVDGIMSSLPSLISMAGDLVIDFCNGLMENAPQLLQQGVSLIVKLVEGIANGLPEIATKAGEVIGNFVEMFLTNLPQILELGIKLTGELAVGLIKALPKVVEAVLNLAKAIIEKFKSMDWKTIGKNIIMGVGEGLKSFVSMVVTAAKETAQKVIDAFKDFFGIHSPSTKMIEIAKDLIQGLINGIKNMAANAASTMLQLGKSLIEKLNPGEWIERGKELGQKLGEGIGNAKDTVASKIGELADTARNKLSTVDLTSAGAAVGNSIANGIKNTKQNISNQMDDIINTLTNKGSSIQNKMASIQYAQSHALMGGAVGTAEMYGAAGDESLSTESEVLRLLERYLPIITQNTSNSQYDAINRQMGWSVT